MKKWKKLLIPAMCVFMLQTPVIANAEAAGSGNAVSVITDPVATPAPAVKNGIYTEGGKKYLYEWSKEEKLLG